MPNLRLLLCALTAVTSLNCGGSEDDQKVVRRSGQPDMVYVKDDDAKMEAGIAKARATVPEFIEALKARKSGDEGFAVKKPFPVRKTQEHIWLTRVSYDGSVFSGTVDNEPVDAKNVTLGEKATVSATELSDWMYIRNGTLMGGQTIRALYDLSTPAGRKKFEKEIGLKP